MTFCECTIYHDNETDKYLISYNLGTYSFTLVVVFCHSVYIVQCLNKLLFIFYILFKMEKFNAKLNILLNEKNVNSVYLTKLKYDELNI
jgi:hypothetical protein